MIVLHGSWIPQDTTEFVQTGAFYVWAETAEPRQTSPGYVVKYPSAKELDNLLINELGLGGVYKSFQQRIRPCHVLMPSDKNKPLPSPELARRLGVERFDIDSITLREQVISACALPQVLKNLADLYFLTSYVREDIKLGQDLLFWVHFGQALKQVLRRDQYIPALRYRPLAAAGRSKKKTAASAYEIHPGWDMISADFEGRLQKALTVMPLACAAASETPHKKNTTFFEPETLLRHFAECTLSEFVQSAAWKLPQTYKTKIQGTLLDDCLHPQRAQTRWSSDQALTRYRQWQQWRQALTAGHAAGVQLGFQLLDAEDEHSPWQLQFVASARQDPSLKVSLGDYWSLKVNARKPWLKAFGQDFEARLLQELGYAARMYSLLWRGLETDKPSGLSLSLEEAFEFLREHAWVLEDAGFKVSVPAWWTPQGRRRARLRLVASGSSKAPAAAGEGYFSLDNLVRYRYELAIGDQTVSEQEWRQLVEAKTPLVQFRGQWLELERDQMQKMIDFWRQNGDQEATMSLAELLHKAAAEDEELDVGQDQTLADMLNLLDEPSRFRPIADPAAIQGTLRDYQKRGVAWLQYLESIGLNGCLADDMGLGKTLQVITLLVTAPPSKHATLLIAPTSVLSNWVKEIEKFAPQLKALIHHGSERPRESKKFQALCKKHDLIITSYTLARADDKLLAGVEWERVVIDEAQAIKNPKTAQTKAILKLKARHRWALTGTPVENRLLDLWSICNFLNPGYLGTQAQFRNRFELPIQKNTDPTVTALLKKLVQPFILRRVKTDKSIIKDLPDKIEQLQYCNLTREQASLYEAVVKDVNEQIEHSEGIQRQGLILSTLTKLKQICNHPRQFLQDSSEFSPARSHKLERLSEMVEEIIAEGESLLIFTQFTEIGEALEKFLRQSFDYTTYYLHGGTNRKRRERLIERFQDPASEPSVFILSLKAGGVGITLTKANHVFHFDRWWNPAVENQATDRAFRIGQSRNVFVHKFVTLGTLEERIEQMIEDKKAIAGAIVGQDESWLSSLNNASFKQLIALNRSAVLD